MFRIASRGLWTLDVLPARPVYLGQATCPIGAPPGTCGEGVDRAQAVRYADLIARAIVENPQCFIGEDLTLAYALEMRLRSFSRSMPEASGEPLSPLSLSEDENRVIQQASGCRIVTLVKPGPVTGGIPSGNGDLRTPDLLKDISNQSQPGLTLPSSDTSKSNLVPVAIGAAGALAFLYALVR